VGLAHELGANEADIDRIRRHEIVLSIEALY
jgi:hypothetical protein